MDGFTFGQCSIKLSCKSDYLTETGLKVTSSLYKMYYVGWCDAETVSTPASDHIP
jgi:hypothetical protein